MAAIRVRQPTPFFDLERSGLELSVAFYPWHKPFIFAVLTVVLRQCWGGGMSHQAVHSQEPGILGLVAVDAQEGRAQCCPVCG